ncbi:MAG TPA: Gfo/Idh/MocA family oxidoreductase [Chlorobaculum parvum]|uniref:Gfo/Idh/MocA family oxidoreductase n=1 Tax=Chlorobaculum parvum TaxID=274539 RepID=A0A7C5DF81_9CHLB|nr:Gfo/Idh/MocA family oxidoreductase [Chlorobaculum parvum]
MRIGVAGVGKLGEFHTNLLTQIASENPDVELSGVFDLNPERLQEIGKKYDVHCFGSLAEMADTCDAAVIATTTSSHYVIAKQLLEAGLSLFIEKPITTTLEEADELIRIEKEKGLTIQVGHIERFNPALLAVEPYIGEPMYIQAERLSGFSRRVTDVSVVLDLMIHDIDLVLSLIKSDIRNIAASGVKVFSNELDMATARIEFENGAIANVTASRLSRSKLRKLRFFSRRPKSYASLDFNSGKSEVFRLVKPEERSSKNPIKNFATKKILEQFGEIQESLKDLTLDYVSPDVPKVNALKVELEQFIDSLRSGRTAVVTSEEGRRALMVAGRITDEIRKNTADLD